MHPELDHKTVIGRYTDGATGPDTLLQYLHKTEESKFYLELIDGKKESAINEISAAQAFEWVVTRDMVGRSEENLVQDFGHELVKAHQQKATDFNKSFVPASVNDFANILKADNPEVSFRSKDVSKAYEEIKSGALPITYFSGLGASFKNAALAVNNSLDPRELETIDIFSQKNHMEKTNETLAQKVLNGLKESIDSVKNFFTIQEFSEEKCKEKLNINMLDGLYGFKPSEQETQKFNTNIEVFKAVEKNIENPERAHSEIKKAQLQGVNEDFANKLTYYVDNYKPGYDKKSYDVNLKNGMEVMLATYNDFKVPGGGTWEMESGMNKHNILSSRQLKEFEFRETIAYDQLHAVVTLGAREQLQTATKELSAAVKENMDLTQLLNHQKGIMKELTQGAEKSQIQGLAADQNQTQRFKM